MNRFQIKEMRDALEYTYFVEEIADDYILVSLVDDKEDDKQYKVFYLKCPDCGSFLLFDLDKDKCKCSNKECEYHAMIQKA